jgi:hypothetical protein
MERKVYPSPSIASMKDPETGRGTSIPSVALEYPGYNHGQLSEIDDAQDDDIRNGECQPEMGPKLLLFSRVEEYTDDKDEIRRREEEGGGEDPDEVPRGRERPEDRRDLGDAYTMLVSAARVPDQNSSRPTVVIACFINTLRSGVSPD